jgi:hypothetical protein
MTEENTAEPVEAERIDPEEIPEFSEESFTGAEKMKNLDRIKEFIEDGKRVFRKVEEAVGDFSRAGKGFLDIIDEAQRLISKAKGEGDDEQENDGSGS